MSEKETIKAEMTSEVKSEGGEMKVSKPKFKKFKSEKEEPFKVDLSQVDTSLEANAKVDEPIKVDLTKKEETDAIQEPSTEKVDVLETSGDGKEVGEAHKEPTESTGEKQEQINPLEEITEDKPEVVNKEEVDNIVVDDVSPSKPEHNLPENIGKLVEFMEKTGGTLEDYVRLNADYSNVNEDVLLKEYYKKTKPHLDNEEIDFVMEENFHYDRDIDEERDVKKKKLAKKEAVAEARLFLEDLKTQYYDQIKLRTGVTEDQKKINEFFNRYNEEQEIATQRHEKFINNTKDLFSNDFKGFDFEVGEKKFRYGVKDPNAVAENQSNLNNFVERFLDKEGNVKDTRGYHKAMYAAQNIDKIVNHFYEQGKSDGIKTVVEGSKNPSLDKARETGGGQDIFIGGLKVRAIDGVDSSKLRIKRSKFNN
tara:strand:- start:452 stop:1720 length:1269 start_codon:yes stop_codon:yes gene_type:complete